jgi:hypothetical protein
MILIKCLEMDTKQNPHNMMSISLYKEEEEYFASFQCKTKKDLDYFHTKVNCLFGNLEEMGENDLFLIDKDIECADNRLVIKGNILNAVHHFSNEGFLRGQDRFTLEDPEEKEIQDFLKQSSKNTKLFEGDTKATSAINTHSSKNTLY